VMVCLVGQVVHLDGGGIRCPDQHLAPGADGMPSTCNGLGSGLGNWWSRERGEGGHEPEVDVWEEPLELPVEPDVPQVSFDEPPELPVVVEDDPSSELLLVLVAVEESAVAVCWTKNTPATDADTAAAVTATPMVSRRARPRERCRRESGVGLGAMTTSLVGAPWVSL
jgi:hypothetical protein